MRLNLLVSVLVVSRCAGVDFSSYAGDTIDSRAAAIAVDAAGNTYVAGTRSFPGTTTSYSVFYGLYTQPLTDVFITKLDPAGNVLFTTTMSGKGADGARAIAIDPAGNIYLAGSTTSTNFPLRNPLYPELSSDMVRGFVAKLSADGRVIYSTYFPGVVSGIAADNAGNTYVTGDTDRSDFPVTAGLPHGRVTRPGSSQIIGAFITKLSADGSRILYSTIISGNALTCGGGSTCFLSIRSNSGLAIAVDPAGAAYVAGYSNVTDLPATPSAVVPRGIGGWIARINAAGTGLDYLTYIGQGNRLFGPYASPANNASAIAVNSAGNVYVAGTTTDPKFSATPGAFQTTSHGPSEITPQMPPADAFVLKLNPQGTTFVYATFLGGSGEDTATGLAVDSAGNAYVTGTTASPDFPQSIGQGRDFVVRLNAAGSGIDYAARFPSGIASNGVGVEPSRRIHIASTGAVVTTLTPGSGLAPRVFGIANAAGGDISGRVDAAEVISIYGEGLGPATPTGAMLDSSGRLSTTLAGVRALFDDTPAPLLYVSENQINAVAPFDLSGKASANLRITFSGSDVSFRATVADVAPQVFRNKGFAAALNEDGAVNSPGTPAKAGSIISVWATGFGTFHDRLRQSDGEITTSPGSIGMCDVLVDGKSADVFYCGPAPGMVAGITQLNFRLPAPPMGTTAVGIAIRRYGVGPASESAAVSVAP